MFKRIISAASTLILCLTIMPISANAAQVDVHVPIDIINEYQVTCTVGYQHQMRGVGAGTVYAGSYSNPGARLLNGHPANQCNNCHLILVSSLNPRHGYGVGVYALSNPGYRIPDGGVTIYGGTNGTYFGNLPANSFWAGFQFI